MKTLRSRSTAAFALVHAVIVIIVLSLVALLWEWHSSHPAAAHAGKPIATAAHHHKSKHGKSGSDAKPVQ